jgi:hypothetical protein
MPSPQLTPELIAEVSSLVSGYITAQREKALPLAIPLSPAQRASMDGFFLPQVLDNDRTGTSITSACTWPSRRSGSPTAENRESMFGRGTLPNREECRYRWRDLGRRTANARSRTD